MYYSFKDNIWDADLADMQSISKFNKGFRFLLCVIDIFSKYTWIVHLEDKKGETVVNVFQSILVNSIELHSTELNSNRKSNKIWVDKGSGFYNTSFEKWLQNKDIEMYSAHNEGKTKNKIYKYMTSISKNVYIDGIDHILNEYNKTYHRTSKMTSINIDKEVNDKNTKFKVGDHVRISKYKNIFAKGYTPN